MPIKIYGCFFVCVFFYNFHKLVESLGYLEQHKLHKDFQVIIWILDVFSLPPVNCQLKILFTSATVLMNIATFSASVSDSD